MSCRPPRKPVDVEWLILVCLAVWMIGLLVGASTTIVRYWP